MTTYIGIDPATKCGWAVLSAEGHRVASGVWLLERRAGDGSGMLFVRFERLFRELLEAYPTGIVAYEQIANRFPGAAHVGLGIQAHIQRICEEVDRPYTGIPPATVKKHATGRGNANKQEMVLAAFERWPALAQAQRPVDDDEADALHVADALRGGIA